MSAVAMTRRAIAAPALLRAQARLLSTSFSTAAPPSRQPTPAATARDNPLMQGGGPLGVSAVARPAGRQSVSGIVATVFGGSGMLGRFVINNLGRIGSQVVVPYRSADGMNVRHLKLAGDLGQIVPIPIDMSDLDSVRRCIARSNVVINLIGRDHETINYSFDDVHAKIPYRLAQVSKAMGVERFIHVSAAGAHPDSSSAFFRSKAEGEMSVREFYPDATIIRPTVMFGPQDDFLSYYAYLGTKLAGIPMTRNGERNVEPVFVGDVSRAILNCLADPASRGQTYELGGGLTYTEAQIIDLVKKHTEQDIRMFNMPDSVARAYGTLIGGRRRLDRFNIGLITNTVLALANKLTLPTIYHADMVAQRWVDRVTSGQLPGLEALGVQATPLLSEIDKVLLPHRAEAPDRFPEAEIMKRDAADNASL